MTVCPPKNTFTDLNYDLMLAEDKKLTDEKKDELYKFAVKNAEENSYMDALNQLQEEKRFYNWYHGYTQISDPKYDQNDKLNYRIWTCALSGVVSTKHFGEKFNDQLFVKNSQYQI